MGFDISSIFGGSGSSDPTAAIIPVGQPQDINSEGDANKLDPKKAYGYGGPGGTSGTGAPTTFSEMRRRQLGAGAEE